MNVTNLVAQAYGISNSAAALQLEASRHIVDMNFAKTVSYSAITFRIKGMEKDESFDIRTEVITAKGTDTLVSSILRKINSFESTKNVTDQAKHEMAIGITEHIARMNWASTNNRQDGTFRNTVCDREIGEGEEYIGYFNASTYVQPGDNMLDIPLAEEHKRRKAIFGSILVPA